jgi:ATP-dependent RNA helicase RhlE
MSFQELGLSAPILRAVVSEGYTTPTPIQSQAIPHVMGGRDLLGCAQTGTGKTAAFALPILHRLTNAGNPPKGSGRRIRVLVLAPTRELALQIGESFRAYGNNTALRQTVVYGGVSQLRQTRALQHGVDILIATPGRLVDLMNQGYIDLSSVQTFVLDEADRMLDMGFMPDLRRVIAKLPTRRQTLMFSATMPDEIARLAEAILQNPVRVRIATAKPATELVEQSVAFVPRAEKTRRLAKFLTTYPITRVLVFTRTKHGADRVARQLQRVGIEADAIHGNKSQGARQRTLADFKENRTQVLVATDIAARGIDVEGISHVVNYELPNEPETYVHRIGRTGRAGASGIAVSFCDVEERSQLKAIERLIRQTLTVDAELSVDYVPPRKPENTAEEAAPQDHSRRRRDNGGRGTPPAAGNRHHGSNGQPPRKRRRRTKFAPQR